MDRVYQIQRMHGRHFFGRRLLRQYANGTATDEVYDVSFVNDEWNNMRLNEMHGEMSDMWTDVIATMRREGADLVRIHISHSDLSKGDIKVPLQSIEKITPEGIMERIEKVMQSNQNLTIDGVLEISIGIIKFPRAQGRHQHLSITSESLKLKRCLVVIENDDTLCLPRALSVSQAWELHQKKELSRKRWSYICDPGRQEQHDMATTMVRAVGLEQDGCSDLKYIGKYEEHIQANIVVVGASQQNAVIYPDQLNPAYSITYYVYYVASTDAQLPGHYHTIKSMTGLLNMSYFCDKCMTGYHHKGEHHYKATCEKCKTTECLKEPTSTTKLPCDVCGVTFRSRDCYDRHLTKTYLNSGKRKGEAKSKSICESFWQCRQCVQYFETRHRTKKDHRCGEMFCRNCKKWDVIKYHQCYIRRPESKKPRKTLIVFDAESNQESGMHIPNLIVARVYDLKTEDYTEVHFRGDDVTDEFCSWLFTHEHKDAVITAHNFKGYDGYFILQYMTKNGIKHSPIYADSKIMTIKIDSKLNMTFIDTLNFFPMTLSQLPKTFGLGDATKKGDFPHAFNVKANYDYVGSYPDISYYNVDSKKDLERTRLI